jgi:hypothetical protein
MADGAAFPTLEAVGSGRIVDVTSLDRPAVFICFAEATQHDADPVEAAVRARYTAAQVLVGHVIDLHTVPSLFRAIARGILDQEHARAVATLPPGETAKDYVVMLPDWDGAFVNALGLTDVSQRLSVAVFAADGTLAGTSQGTDVPAGAIRLLEQALGV